MRKEEFDKKFSTPYDCVKYIFEKRWKNSFCCPRCGNTAVWLTKDGKCKCTNSKAEKPSGKIGKCGYMVSATKGTIFYSGVSIDRAFLLLWYLSADCEEKMTALQLHEATGISKHTISDMRNRLKPVFEPEIKYTLDKLSGSVELDIHPVRIEDSTQYLLVAAEVANRKIGKVRSRIVNDKTDTCIVEFLSDCVEIGTCIVSNLSEVTKKAFVDADYTVIPRFGFIYQLYAAKEAYKQLIDCVDMTANVLQNNSLIDKRCAEYNSRLLPVPFEIVLERAVAMDTE